MDKQKTKSSTWGHPREDGLEAVRRCEFGIPLVTAYKSTRIQYEIFRVNHDHEDVLPPLLFVKDDHGDGSALTTVAVVLTSVVCQ